MSLGYFSGWSFAFLSAANFLIASGPSCSSAHARSMLATWPTEGTTDLASTSAVEQQFQTRFCYQQYRDQTDIANCLKVTIR